MHMVMGYTRYRPMLLSCFLAVCCWQAGNTKGNDPTDTTDHTDYSNTSSIGIITWPPCQEKYSLIEVSCEDMRSMNCSVQHTGKDCRTDGFLFGQDACASISHKIQIQVCNKTVYVKTAWSCSAVLSFLNDLTAISVSLLHDSTYNLTATAHGNGYTGTINCTDASSNIRTATISMTASSAPDNAQGASTSSNATNVGAIAAGTIVPIVAIAVIIAILIILVLRKSTLQRERKPPKTEVSGLDNVVYNDSSTTIGMSTLAPYEPLNDVEKANYDYIDEDCNPYIIPASHEEELYVQLENQSIKEIPRNKIEATTMLGSGQFGGVQIGIWNGSKGKCEVAIKTLNPTITQPDAKVKFLQEAAIMAQFRHPNVIQLYGIVTDGEPIMLVLELANKKDLYTYLNTLKPDPGQMVHSDIPISLLTYSKQIAAGMKYLSNKLFVHRDLAARNILVTQDCICKIADFGMSRDLADDTYYVSHGGMVPIKWTAPEAIHFKKYSTASDVWSYGCLLYEIWSMGMKPFEGKGNAEVVQKVDSGYRLPPPPGCPLLVYQLMIQCWNPETHSRPKFGDIFQCLRQPNEMVLVIPDEAHLTHPQAGVLGAPLEAGENMYIELQKTYTVYV